MSNRAARRQQARKRDKARRYDDVVHPTEIQKEDEKDSSTDKEQTSEDEGKASEDGGGINTVEYWGFLPDDYPLSDTDDEAEDPVKEREERVIRSRKRQLHDHLYKAFNDSQRPEWGEVFSQARMLEIKWLDDDLSHARSQASRNATSWPQELPRHNGRTWLSFACDTLQAIKETYAGDVTQSVEKEGNVYKCGDRFKAMVIATAFFKEYVGLLPEAMQAMMEENEGESMVPEDERVLGFEYVEGPEGVPCIGVRLRKKDSAEDLWKERAMQALGGMGPPS